MQDVSAPLIGIALLVVLALIVFLVIRNRKDRKNIFPPDVTDNPVQKDRMDQHRREGRT